MIGVEAAGCAPYVSSLEKGEIEPVHQTTTIADGIAVKRPGEVTFPLVRELVDDVVTVTDAEIGQTMVHLLERSKTVVEGAGAVGLAAILAGRVSGRKVVAVLSGGNIDTPLLMQVIRFGLTNQGRYLVIRTRLIDRPGPLMELLKLIADAHVNILVVSHHRESVEVAVAETGIELILETRDEAPRRADRRARAQQRVPRHPHALSVSGRCAAPWRSARAGRPRRTVPSATPSATPASAAVNWSTMTAQRQRGDRRRDQHQLPGRRHRARLDPLDLLQHLAVAGVLVQAQQPPHAVAVGVAQLPHPDQVEAAVGDRDHRRARPRPVVREPCQQRQRSATRSPG